MEQEPTRAEDYVSLYRRAFAEYRYRALWNRRMLDEPTPEAALVVARALRIEGNREARKLAEQIEQACRAAENISDARAAEKALAEMEARGEKPIPWEIVKKEAGL